MEKLKLQKEKEEMRKAEKEGNEKTAQRGSAATFASTTPPSVFLVADHDWKMGEKEGEKDEKTGEKGGNGRTGGGR